jgi:hypothetical protein
MIGVQDSSPGRQVLEHILVVRDGLELDWSGVVQRGRQLRFLGRYPVVEGLVFVVPNVACRCS